jgi:predicted AAA+ superfamily ATPase
MYARLFSSNISESYFIFGPRGTGKTSWLRSHFPKAPLFDLLEDDVRFDLGREAKQLGIRISPDYQGPVILDEIQKLPTLLDEVHRLIELRKGLQFILTGSSARKLKKQGVNLLGGRALVKRMYPMTAEELGSDFNLKKALQIGMLPKVWSTEHPTAFLKAYIQLYVDLEVKLEGLVRDLDGFRRFLAAASFSQGSVLNVSSVAQECGVERRTVSNFFEILNDLLISYELPVFSKKAKRKLIQHNKFYYFDVGVYNTLRPQGPLDSPESIQGVALETLVLQELVAQIDYRNLEYEIFFWRTQTQLEVDFILYGKSGFIAIEAKLSSRLRAEDFEGLEAFLEDYPNARAILIYGGDQAFQHGKIEVMDANRFFREAGNLLST